MICETTVVSRNQLNNITSAKLFRSFTGRCIMLASLFAVAGTVAPVAQAAGPKPVLLWAGTAPGAVGKEDQDKPSLQVYLPPQGTATGTGVVICPGGGYAALATDHEGHQVAKWFNSIGVAAFVLKYRLGRRYHHPAPLLDAQRALRFVRYHAKELGVVPNRIGIMGFSAGGHLASTAATHWNRESEKHDTMDQLSCRPDFTILGYPVITFTAEYTHTGSKRNLLGENADDAELVNSLSNEKQVTPETPPTFLFHTGEDQGVPVENSLDFYRACLAAKVPAELHIYQYGPHGVGLGPGDPVLYSWKDRLADWLKTSGFLADVERASVDGQVKINGEPLRWGTITFVPADSNNKPVAWARVSRGKFSIPERRGAVVGVNRVEIRDLGAVEPRVTLEDVRLFNQSNPNNNSPLTVTIEKQGNLLSYELTSK